MPPSAFQAGPSVYSKGPRQTKQLWRAEALCCCLSALRRHKTFPLSFPFLPEYAAINSMLDQINSCLDHLEEKNDHLHARLQELLESNRQTRLEFQQQLGEAPGDASP